MADSTGTLPTPVPPLNLETEPFWEATTKGKLLLKRCTACSTVIWYPRAICPACGSSDTAWFEASGKGTVYTFTVNHRGEGYYRGAGPYVLAYVELEEGPRIMTNIVDVDPDAVEIGMPVEVTFHDTGEGAALHRFRPAAS